MAEAAHIILKRAREMHEPKMQQWRLAQEIGVSEDTIKRWEGHINGSTPDPDDVDRIEKALGETGLWHRWMIAQFDSFRERYTEVPNVEYMGAAVTQTKYEVHRSLQKQVKRRSGQIRGVVL